MKKFASLFLCLILTATICCGVAGARASNYLKVYSAALITGDSRGQLELNYNEAAKTTVTSIGVSKIELYTADGDHVKTIYGSTSNGLMYSSGLSHYDTYTISATAGEEYYAVVTFKAGNSSGSGTGTYTTGVAMAKR